MNTDETDGNFHILKYKVQSKQLQSGPNLCKTKLHKSLTTGSELRNEVGISRRTNKSRQSTICLEHILRLKSVDTQISRDAYRVKEKNKNSPPHSLRKNASKAINCETFSEYLQAAITNHKVYYNSRRNVAVDKVEPTEEKSSGKSKGQSSESEIPDDLFTGGHLRVKPQDVIVNIVTSSKSSHSKSKHNTPHQKVKKGKGIKCIQDSLNQNLNKEKERILTFMKYPRDANMSALLLAANGFVYKGSGKDDTVQCFFCRKNKNILEWTDTLEQTHKKSCEMRSTNNGKNEPLNVNMNKIMKPLRIPQDSLRSNQVTPIRSDTVQFATKEIPKLKRFANLRTSSALGHLSVEASQGNESVMESNLTQFENTTAAIGGTSQRSSTFKLPTVSSLVSASSQSNQREEENTSSETSTVTSSPEILGRITQETGRESSSLVTTSLSTNSNQLAETLVIEQLSTPTSAGNFALSVQTNPVSVLTSSDVITRGITQESEAALSSNVTTSLLTNPNQTTESPIAAPLATSTPAETFTQSAPTNPVSVTSINSSTMTVSEGSVTTALTRPNNGSSPTYVELGIITERPKRPEYALKLKRSETFTSWPRDHHISPEELVNAGFYYAGYGDCTRCFYCGGGLRNWEDEDNVWVEHARWFPRCAYIRQQMGQVFVDTVQGMNNQFDKISMEMVKQRLGVSSTTFQLDSLNIPLKRDPAVQSIVALGYLEKDVLEMTQLIQQEGNTISSDLILEKLLRENKRPNQSQCIVSLPATDTSEVFETIRKLKEKNGHLRQQTSCKICMES
ncbi:hypothetical protein Btru_068741 [Bulinus truncatus]|nr:hypothetical protein Btru_068741 [Bulinus truncatus]